MFGIKRALKRLYVEKQINKERNYESFLVLKNVRGGVSLTDEEKKAVISLWGSIATPIKWDEYEVYKSINGFDARFLSHEIYLPLVARKLNNYHYTKFFEDKGLLGRLGSCGLDFPYCCVRCIDGEYYDNSMSQLSDRQALDICLSEDVLIWKPSRNSSGGKNIEKVELLTLTTEEKRREVTRLLRSHCRDFVIQRCLRQHSSMSAFCKSSINTVRVTTLYLNGKPSCQNIILRVGHEGTLVDNWGSGGLMCRVMPDGSLSDRGFTSDLQTHPSINGVTLKGKRLDFMPSLIEKLLQAHKEASSLCKLIGWDICIDEAGKPVVIELNSSQPGIFGEQMCGGPIFGERTEEVVEYVKTKQFIYNRAIIRY